MSDKVIIEFVGDFDEIKAQLLQFENSLKQKGKTKMQVVDEGQLGMVEKLERKLQSLNDQLRKAQSVKDIKLINSEIRATEKELSRLRPQLSVLESQFKTLAIRAAAAFSVTAIAGYISKLWELEERIDAVARSSKVIYGEAFPALEKRAKAVANQIGLTTSQYMKMATTSRLFLENIGIIGEENEKMTEGLIKTATTLALFDVNGRSAEETMETLTRSIIGSTKGLRSYGITVEGVSEEEAALMSETKKISNAYNTYNAIIEQTRKLQAGLNDEMVQSEIKERQLEAQLRQNAEELARRSARLKNTWLEMKVGAAQMADGVLYGNDQLKGMNGLMFRLTSFSDPATASIFRLALEQAELAKQTEKANKQLQAQAVALRDTYERPRSILEAYEDRILGIQKLMQRETNPVFLKRMGAELKRLQQEMLEATGQGAKGTVKQEKKQPVGSDVFEVWKQNLEAQKDFEISIAASRATSLEDFAERKYAIELENLILLKELYESVGLDAYSIETQIMVTQMERREKLKKEEEEKDRARIERQKQLYEQQLQARLSIVEKEKQLEEARARFKFAIAEQISGVIGAGLQSDVLALIFEKSLAITKMIIDYNKARLQIAAQLAAYTSVGNVLGIAQSSAALGILKANFATSLATVIGTSIPQFIGALKSQGVAGFAQGTSYVDGGGSQTSDSVLARLSRGERVVTAEKNQKYWNELEAIHRGDYEKYVNQKYILPTLSAATQKAMDLKDEKLATAIATTMMGSDWKGDNIVMELHKQRNNDIRHHKELVQVIARSSRVSKRKY